MTTASTSYARLSAAAAIAALAILWPAMSRAHTRSESYSVWSIRGSEVVATITIPALEVTRIPAAASVSSSMADRFAAYLSPRIHVWRGASECPAAGPPLALKSAEGYVRVEARFVCAEGPPDTIAYLGLFDVAPSHVDLARAVAADGATGEFLFSSERTQWHLPPAISGRRTTMAPEIAHGRLRSLAQFIQLGVGHITSGLDHIAFLATVTLAAAGLRNTLIAVTGFTLGHSLTLSLAVLGVAHPDPPLVEALIGLTIAIVAIESVALRSSAGRWLGVACAAGIAIVAACALATSQPRTHAAAYLGMALFAYCYLAILARLSGERGRRRGWLIAVATAVFGMVHGFGFAGFLLSTGLVGRQLAAPLLGFNLGVEAGQLAIVTVIWLAGYALDRFLSRAASRIEQPLAAAAIAAVLCGLGVFWFVSRTFS